MRVARTWALASLAILSGCRVNLDSSGSFAPTEPGIVSITPAAVVLRPGQSIRPQVTLRDEAGQIVSPGPTFTLVSSDSIIAPVQDDLVIGLTPGRTEIMASDGAHAPAYLTVVVSDTAPTGPYALACDPSVVTVAAGAVAPLGAVITDAAGNVVDGSGVVFEIEGESAALEGSSVRGLASGVSFVTARTPEGTYLEGYCTVVTATPTMSSGVPGGRICEPSEEWMCWGTRWPMLFTRTGLSSELRVSVIRTYFTEDCRIYSELTWRAPHTAEVTTPGVVDVFAGRAVSVAPGLTTIRLSVDGAECGAYRVQVLMDVGGTWGVECGNGDYGTVQINPLPVYIATNGRDEYIPAGGAISGGAAWDSWGSSSLCNDREIPPFRCDGASSMSAEVTRIGPSEGPCTGAVPCYAPSVSHCASGRHVAETASMDSPDHFEIGDCSYTRGGGGRPATCRPCDGFECGDGTCIDPSLVCNRASNCSDGSDEDPATCGDQTNCCMATHGCPGETGSSCAASCCCCPVNQACCADWRLGCCPA